MLYQPHLILCTENGKIVEQGLCLCFIEYVIVRKFWLRWPLASKTCISSTIFQLRGLFQYFTIELDTVVSYAHALASEKCVEFSVNCHTLHCLFTFKANEVSRTINTHCKYCELIYLQLKKIHRRNVS